MVVLGVVICSELDSGLTLTRGGQWLRHEGDREPYVHDPALCDLIRAGGTREWLEGPGKAVAALFDPTKPEGKQVSLGESISLNVGPSDPESYVDAVAELAARLRMSGLNNQESMKSFDDWRTLTPDDLRSFHNLSYHLGEMLIGLCAECSDFRLVLAEDFSRKPLDGFSLAFKKEQPLIGIFQVAQKDWGRNEMMLFGDGHIEIHKSSGRFDDLFGKALQERWKGGTVHLTPV